MSCKENVEKTCKSCPHCFGCNAYELPKLEWRHSGKVLARRDPETQKFVLTDDTLKELLDIESPSKKLVGFYEENIMKPFFEGLERGLARHEPECKKIYVTTARGNGKSMTAFDQLMKFVEAGCEVEYVRRNPYIINIYEKEKEMSCEEKWADDSKTVTNIRLDQIDAWTYLDTDAIKMLTDSDMKRIVDMDVPSLYPQHVFEPRFKGVFTMPTKCEHFNKMCTKKKEERDCTKCMVDEVNSYRNMIKGRDDYIQSIESSLMIHSRKFEIKDVIFNPPATIVFWADGSKTVVKCQGKDKYDPEKGLAMAISKRALGDTREYFHTFLKYDKKWKKEKPLHDWYNEEIEVVADNRTIKIGCEGVKKEEPTEEPTGHWLTHYNSVGRNTIIKCSKCGAMIVRNGRLTSRSMIPDWCPNCYSPMEHKFYKEEVDT